MLLGSMTIVGERLNSTRAAVKRIFAQRDRDALAGEVRAQEAGGASFIDLNASMLMGEEEEALRWGARIVRDLGLGVSLDSPDAGLLMKLAPEFGAGAIVNSLVCDAALLSRALPAAAESGAGVVILLKGERAVPRSAAERAALAAEAAGACERSKIDPSRVYFDPVFLPLATAPGGAGEALAAIAAIRDAYPANRRIGGLSNVSFGLPARRLLNRTYLAMAVWAGLDAVICDPTDAELVDVLSASSALAGRDPACRAYLERYRRAREARS